MKKVFSFFALAAIVLSVGLNSCSKDDPADALNVDTERTATLKGKVLINANETDPRWSAPATVTITATVPYNSLNSKATGNYVVPKENITYTAATGEFTIIAPVGVTGSTISVTLDQFPGTVTQSAGTINVIWNKSEGSEKVTPGSVGYLPEWTKSGSGAYKVVSSVNDKI